MRSLHINMEVMISSFMTLVTRYAFLHEAQEFTLAIENFFFQ